MNYELLRQFCELGVATVYEASGRQGLLDIPLIPLIPGRRVAGPARTVRCGQGDNLMVHAVMEFIRPGDVLVLTMPEPEPVALIGELLAIQARVRGATAILVDGAVRDVRELQALGLPIWTRYVRVRGATKEKLGAIDEPIQVGGTTVHPGDIVVLDDDGAVVIPTDKAVTVLQSALARQDHEHQLRLQLTSGQLSYDLLGLRPVVEGQGKLLGLG